MRALGIVLLLSACGPADVAGAVVGGVAGGATRIVVGATGAAVGLVLP